MDNAHGSFILVVITEVKGEDVGTEAREVMIEGRIMWVVGFFVPRFYDIPTFTHTLSTPPPTMDPRRSYHLRSSRSLCPSCEVSVRWVKDTEHTASLAGWKDRNDLSFSDMLCTHRLSYRSLGALSLDLGVQSMEEAGNYWIGLLL